MMHRSHEGPRSRKDNAHDRMAALRDQYEPKANMIQGRRNKNRTKQQQK